MKITIGLLITTFFFSILNASTMSVPVGSYFRYSSGTKYYCFKLNPDGTYISVAAKDKPSDSGHYHLVENNLIFTSNKGETLSTLQINEDFKSNERETLLQGIRDNIEESYVLLKAFECK